MPESFDGMLAELADAAAAATALPDVAAVRRRARQRTVRRRLVASVVALSVLAVCGGTVAAVSARSQGRVSAGPLAAPAAAGPGPESLGPSTGAARAGSAGSAAAGTASGAWNGPIELDGEGSAFAAVTGVWRTASPQRELIVFPDGRIGMSASGEWALCAGTLKPAAGGVRFLIVALACGDEGTAGLSLRLQADGTMALAVPARGSAPAATVTYLRDKQLPAGADVTSAGAAAGASGVKLLAGTWLGVGAVQRQVDIGLDGEATVAGLDDTGPDAGAAGVIEEYYGDTALLEIPCARPTSGLAYCQVLELQYQGKGQLTVVGGDGAETFLAGGFTFTGAYGTVSSPSAAMSGASQGPGTG